MEEWIKTTTGAFLTIHQMANEVAYKQKIVVPLHVIADEKIFKCQWRNVHQATGWVENVQGANVNGSPVEEVGTMAISGLHNERVLVTGHRCEVDQANKKAPLFRVV